MSQRISRLYSTIRKAIDYETVNFHKQIGPNQTYHPRDLNERHFKPKKEQKQNDIIRMLDIDVKKEYKNTKLLSYFVTSIGSIKPSEKTGLDSRNQRKIAKAIKRARHFGLLPFTFKQ
jgi:ribosomal protein S18